MGNIRYCEQCGHALSEESQFCEYCGAAVPRPMRQVQRPDIVRRDRKELQNEIYGAYEKRRNSGRGDRPQMAPGAAQRREDYRGSSGASGGTDRRTASGASVERTDRRTASGAPVERTDRRMTSGAAVDRAGHRINSEAPGNRRMDSGVPMDQAGRRSSSGMPMDQADRPDRRAPGGSVERSGYRRTPGVSADRPDRRSAPGVSSGRSGQRLPSGTPPRQAGRRIPPDSARDRSGRYAAQDAKYPERGVRRTYRQEGLGEDWEQSWNRGDPYSKEERKFTVVQYILLAIVAVLIVALITFGFCWAVVRMKTQDSGGTNGQAHTGTVQTEDVTGGAGGDDAITILDGGGTQAPEETTKPTEKQTERPQVQNITLNYSEYEVTLPADWSGKYEVEQDGADCVFYQKAARAEGYSGVIFIISRYEDSSYKELPHFEVLGTGNQAAFIWNLPSGEEYEGGTQAVIEEYRDMTGDLDWIRSNIRVLANGEGPAETDAIQILDPQAQQPSDPAAVGESGYILADSATRALTDADVTGLSYDDLQMAINEIYARHGRIFQTESINSHFASQPWYHGTLTAEEFDESVFSATEAENIQFLLDKMEEAIQ